jgi:hypothetical protein
MLALPYIYLSQGSSSDMINELYIYIDLILLKSNKTKLKNTN